MTIGVPIVICLPRLYQQCTNSVPIDKTVKNSQKTVKTAKMTIMYQSSAVRVRVHRIHKALSLTNSRDGQYRGLGVQFTFDAIAVPTMAWYHMSSSQRYMVRAKCHHQGSTSLLWSVVIKSCATDFTSGHSSDANWHNSCSPSYTYTIIVERVFLLLQPWFGTICHNVITTSWLRKCSMFPARHIPLMYYDDHHFGHWNPLRYLRHVTFLTY